MAGQFRENWKRMANKLPPLNEGPTAQEDKDLVRVEDLNGFAGLIPESGSLIVGSGNSWIRLPIGPEGFVPKSVNGQIQWQADVSGIASIDLSGSGFVVGPPSATNGSVAIYDGTTGKLIAESLVLIDSSGNLSVAGNTIISGDLTVLGNSNFNSLTVNNFINSGTVINSVVASTGVVFTITNQYFNAIQSGTTTVIMPPTPASGLTTVIKDVAGTAGTTPITVNGNGNTIDGNASTQLVSDFEAITLILGPTEWNII